MRTRRRIFIHQAVLASCTDDWYGPVEECRRVQPLAASCGRSRVQDRGCRPSALRRRIFDAVINVESSHCYPSLEKFLSEVRRVLRPGGHFLYADFRERGNVAAWRNMLRDSRLDVLREMDITANVVTALDRDNDRKLDLIQRLIPNILRRSFLDFAAVRGSALFEAFRSGKLVYMSFVLQKPRP